MRRSSMLRITVCLIACLLLQVDGADKYTDENRPYEFGFTIDGQQHRHEKKDEDGIIMGEFGFVTADDVYHVTVYATDKEGRFKILSMKNIHLKSYQAGLGPSNSTRQGHALALPPAQSVAQTQTPLSQPKKEIEHVSLEPPVRSCSSCSLPTTTTRKPPQPPVSIPQNNQFGSPNQFSSPNQFGTSVPQGPSSASVPGSNQFGGLNQFSVPNRFGSPNQVSSSIPQTPSSVSQPNFGASPNYPANEQDYNSPVYPQQGQTQQTYPSPQDVPNIPQDGLIPSIGQNQGVFNQPAGIAPGGQNSFTGSQNYPEGGNAPNAGPGNYGNQNNFAQGSLEPRQPGFAQSGSGDRAPKEYTGSQPQYNNNNSGPNGPQGSGSVGNGQPGPAKPTLVSAQMQIVDKNTDIHALSPGEKEGLPPGLTESDMTDILYTFNYTVGFHGHFEEGYRNGDKKGYYYATGRNGIRTRIDYAADKTGFHPKVSQEVLDLLSEDVPKPETEKDAKYGLKGYEFKWLYYPVDSKRR